MSNGFHYNKPSINGLTDINSDIIITTDLTAENFTTTNIEVDEITFTGDINNITTSQFSQIPNISSNTTEINNIKIKTDHLSHSVDELTIDEDTRIEGGLTITGIITPEMVQISNTFFGVSNISRTLAATYNTHYGYNNGKSTMSGNYNNLLGSLNGFNLTTGYNNTLLGYQNGYYMTTGYNNVGIGKQALLHTTTGYENVAVGNEAMGLGPPNYNTGYRNCALGMKALYSVTTANSNIAIGYSALSALTTGIGNIGIGKSTVSTNGSYNVIIGDSSSSSTYNDTIVLGRSKTATASGQFICGDGTCLQSEISNLSGVSSNIQTQLNDKASLTTSNTFSNSNTYNSSSTITFNNVPQQTLAVSTNAMYGCDNALKDLTTAQTTIFGKSSGKTGMTGDFNTMFGYGIGAALTTGEKNTFIGTSVGKNTTTGNQNTAIGYNTFINNTTGSFNMFLGGNSQGPTTGGRNTAVGYSSRCGLTSSNSISIGYKAGANNNDVSPQCIAIGSDTGNALGDTNSYSNSIAIGHQVTWNGSNQIRLGNSTQDTYLGNLLCSNVNGYNYKHTSYLGSQVVGNCIEVTSSSTTFSSGVDQTYTPIDSSSNNLLLRAGVYMVMGSVDYTKGTDVWDATSYYKLRWIQQTGTTLLNNKTLYYNTDLMLSQNTWALPTITCVVTTDSSSAPRPSANILLNTDGTGTLIFQVCFTRIA